MANSHFSDNLNKTIARGYNVFGQARAIANALGVLEGRGNPVNLSKSVASEIRKNGIARPTYAYAMITPPQALSSKIKSKSSALNNGHHFLTYRNDSFSTPGIGLTTTDIRRYGYGPTEKKPTGVVYQDVTFNYILDTTHNQHKFFYNWMDLIVSHSAGAPGNGGKNFQGMYSYEVGYKNTYTTNIEIYSFDDRFDNAEGPGRTVVKLHDAYPTFIGDIQYNWASVDTLIRLPVTFTYRYWDLSFPDIAPDLNPVGGPQTGLFGNLLKVGTAIQALSTLRSPRNIQDVVNLVNVTNTMR
jgi:hypothetical protein